MSAGNGNGKRPSFDNRVSLGNLLSIIAMLITMFFFFGDLRERLAVVETKVGNFVARLASVERRIDDVEHPPIYRGGRRGDYERER